MHRWHHAIIRGIFVMRCAIWYYLYNLKNLKNTHGAVLILVKLQVSSCNFTKINTPPWVFFTFFKLYKWYQIAQRTTFRNLPNTFDGAVCENNWKLKAINYFQKTPSWMFYKDLHCVKTVPIRSFSGPYFPAFGHSFQYKNHR